MNNIRILSILFALTLLLEILIGFIEFESDLMVFILNGICELLSLVWLYILIRDSGFTRTGYFRVICIFLSISMVGALFKLQHWPHAGELLIIGLMGVSITYLVRFIRKKNYRLLDFAKLFWVETTVPLRLAKMQHWISDDYRVIDSVLFMFLIGVYVLSKERNRD